MGLPERLTVRQAGIRWGGQLAALALLAAACAGGTTVSPTSSSTNSTITIDQNMSGIAWLDSNDVIVAYAPNDTSLFRLATVNLSGTVTPLAPPPAADCDKIRLANPVTIAPRRIALSQECLPPLGSPLSNTISVLSLDLATGKYATLASAGETQQPAGQIAPGPGASRFLISYGDLCAVIVEAAPAGPETLPVEVGDGRSTFSLADIAPGPDCSQRGWAAWPTWDAATDEIAFFAAPTAKGDGGSSRGEAPAELYVMTPGDVTATSILSGVTVARSVRYSPDGRRLAFGGTISGVKATWVLDRDTRNVSRVYDGRLDWLAWSPDGTNVVGLEVSDPAKPRNDRIVVVRVDGEASPTSSPSG